MTEEELAKELSKEVLKNVAKEKLFEAVDKIWERNKIVSTKKIQKDVAGAAQAVR